MLAAKLLALYINLHLFASSLHLGCHCNGTSAALNAASAAVVSHLPDCLTFVFIIMATCICVHIPGGGYTRTNPELRRIVPNAKGRPIVKVVYVVLEAQYQSSLTAAVKNINATRSQVRQLPSWLSPEWCRSLHTSHESSNLPLVAPMLAPALQG